MTKPNHYDVLGVPVDATPEQIKKAHRKAAQRTHPDRNPDADPAEAAAVNVAADVLLDPARRLEYDSAGYREGKEGRIFTVALELLQKLIESALDAEAEDIVVFVQITLQNNIKANSTRIGQLQSLLKKLRKRRARVTRKKAAEPNLIHLVIDHRSAAAAREIEGLEIGLEGLRAAQDAFTGYVDTPEPSQSHDDFIAAMISGRV